MTHQHMRAQSVRCEQAVQHPFNPTTNAPPFALGGVLASGPAYAVPTPPRRPPAAGAAARHPPQIAASKHGVLTVKHPAAPAGTLGVVHRPREAADGHPGGSRQRALRVGWARHWGGRWWVLVLGPNANGHVILQQMHSAPLLQSTWRAPAATPAVRHRLKSLGMRADCCSAGTARPN